MLPPLSSNRHIADNQNQSFNINDLGSPHKMQYPYSNSIDLKINGPLGKQIFKLLPISHFKFNAFKKAISYLI